MQSENSLFQDSAKDKIIHFNTSFAVKHHRDSNEITGKNRCAAQALDSFFSKIVSNLKISEYINNKPKHKIAADSIIKLRLKYRNYPSIHSIREVC